MRPALQHVRSFFAMLIASTLVVGTGSPCDAQVNVAGHCQLVQAAGSAVMLQLSTMSVAQTLEGERTQGPRKYTLFAWAAANAQRRPTVEQIHARSLSGLQLEAHAVRARGVTGEFERAISKQLQDSTLSSDDRAYCMLALAYDQEIAGAKSAPLAGKLWIDRALASDSAVAARQDCIEYLVIRYVWARSFAEARSIVLGSEAIFTTDRSRMTVLMNCARENAFRSAAR